MYKFQVSAWKKLVFLMLLAVCAVTGRAQIYPVQLSTQVSPPYSVYLPDYTSPGGEKLRLVLLQRDLTIQGYRLRFEMKVQVNGITIMQTSKSAMPPPIMLQPGIPTVLGGSDLGWYVQPQNLEFGGGYNSSTYEQSRSLPEGAITITFTAYDYVRSDLQVSASSSSFFYATRDNPPLLNYPACGMQVTPINPQFLNFSWLPQNTSSPNSALQTNYIFSLWAVLPAGYNFQDIVQSTRPLYSVTTQTPTLVYGPGEPPLVPGQSYAWRVQAVDITGRDIFRNNGYSETCNFIYGGDSGQGIVNYPAIQINAASAGPAQGKVWWTMAGAGSGVPGTGGLAASGYDQYRLYYRKAQGNYDWFSVDVNDSMYRIFDLEPSTTYECRLQGHKSGSYGPYTDVMNFTTDAPKTIGCTDNTSLLNPYSGRPLAVASGGMNITYGPWDVQLLTVQALGLPGQFRGTCKVTVPFMGGMTFNAKFDNLTIDDSRNVTAGTINFLSQGMQAWVDSSIKHQMGGDMYGKVVSGTDTANVSVPVSLANLDHLDVVLKPDSTITSFAVPGTSVVVPVNDGMVEVTIKDSNGSTYSLDNQGKLTQLTFADGSLHDFFADPQNVAGLNTLATDMGTVNFTDADAKYAFDSWKPFYAQGSTILTGQYEKLNGGSGDYYVSQKAIGSGESDIVGVSFRLADGMTGDSVVFATGKGERLIWDPKDSTLNLLGGPAADAQEVYALYPKPGGGYYSLGKLLVSAYEHKDFTAVLVPVVAGDGEVPNVDVQKYADSLNSIYNKVNISWTVIPDSAYKNTSWDMNGDGKLTMAGSSFLSNTLTGEPAALVNGYSTQRPVDKTRKYIFFLNTSGGNTGDPGGMAGDMPRGTLYGFVFLDQSGTPEQTAVTVAHELGHGQFNLEHTFSGDIALGGPGATKTYPNLMDYQVGSYVHLYKYQWNQVHQPGQVIGILEGDNAGQDIAVNNYLSSDMLNDDKLYFSFLTPNAKRIFLPKNIQNPIFAYSITNLQNYNLVGGVLVGFTIVNGKTTTNYKASMVNNQFYGYITTDANKTEYANTVPADVSTESLVMLFPATMTSLREIKFKIGAGKLENYTPLNYQPEAIVDERGLGTRIKLFGSDAALAKETDIPVTPSLVGGLYNDLSQQELDIVDSYQEDPELLPLLKAAAWEKLYPTYYNRYTSGVQRTGIYCTPDNDGPQCKVWEKQDYDTEQVLTALRSSNEYEYFCVFLDSVRRYCLKDTGQTKNVIANLSDNSDWQSVMEAFAGMSDVDMGQLTLPQRVLLLKFAIKNGISDSYSTINVPQEFEEVVVRLFKNTPVFQQNAFLDSLAQAKDFDNKFPHLLAALCKDVVGLDGDQWKEFAGIINTWIFTYKPRTDKFSITDQVTNKKVLIFDNNQGLYVLEKLAQLSSLLTVPDAAFFTSHYTLTEDFVSNGQIAVSSYKDQLFSKSDLRSLQTDPYAYVYVYFKEDNVFPNGVKVAKGSILPLPAFMVYSLFNDVNTGRIIVGIKTSVDVALLFVGVGELSAAVQAADGASGVLGSWQFYKSLADLTVFSADIVINDALGDKLAKDAKGQQVLYYWNLTSMTYSFGRLGYEGMQALKTYSTSFNAAAEDYKKANNIEEGSEDANSLEKMENTLAAMAGDAQAAESAAVEAFLVKNNLKGSPVEALLKNAGSGTGGMLTQLTAWNSTLFPKLNAALTQYAGLAGELTQDASLLAHFSGMNTSYYYRLGLARAYKVTGAGSITLPDNFGNVLKDLDMFNGVSIRSIFDKTPSEVAGILGSALEEKVGGILEEAWRGGVTGIQNADLPADLKNYYINIYNSGYTKMIQQVTITTASGKNPIPDLFFFKTQGGRLSMADVIYHDVKIYSGTAFSTAQKEIKTAVDAAAKSGTPAQFVLADRLDFEGASYPAGTSLTIKEMSKVCTEVSNNSIDLIRK